MLDKAIALGAIAFIRIAWPGTHLLDLLTTLAAYQPFGVEACAQTGAHFFLARIAFYII